MHTRIALAFTLVLFFSSSFAEAENKSAAPTYPVHVEAFGGTIPIPTDSILRAAIAKDGSLRLVASVEKEKIFEVDILSVSISRPSVPAQVDGDVLTSTNEYRLNGFDVSLFEADPAYSGTSLIAARIERCGESGQIIAREKAAIDSFLLTASEATCDMITNPQKP